MSHEYHGELPGYREESFLHDGCPECDERAQKPLDALLHMDPETFAHFWEKMLEVEFRSKGAWTSKNDKAVGEAAYFIGLMLQRNPFSMVVPR